MKILSCAALSLMTVVCCSGAGGTGEMGASGAGGSLSAGTGGRVEGGEGPGGDGDAGEGGVGGQGGVAGAAGAADGGALEGLAGGDDEGRGPGMEGGGRGGSGPLTAQIAEAEPNDGPTLTGMQDLGTFEVSKTIVLKGKLATGGNDGAKYTGDYDAFVFSVAAAGGTLALKADWLGAADVDLVFYDANLSPVFEDGTAAKPIQSTGPAPGGKFAFVLFSKDLPADWTVTLTYTKPVPTSDASCTSPLQEDATGGCEFTPLAPANGASLTLPAEIGFTSCGCETPVKIYIYGNPPTLQNAYYIEKIRGSAPLCSWTGRSSITQEDLTQFGITSDNGLYHWQIRSWHGALGPARTFTLAPSVCK